MMLRASKKTFYPTLFVAYLLWLFVFEFALTVYINQQAARQSVQNFQEANSLRVLIEKEINIAAFLANGIESYIVAREGKVDDTELQKMLALIYERGPYFRNIGIAPNNQISTIYPLPGNEAAIGLRYEDNPKQWPVVQKIISTKQGRLAGPLTLVQGGRGLIYRTPIFIDQDYWGLLSTVINADRIFVLMEQNASDAIEIALRGKDALGDQGEVFYGNPGLFQGADQELSISVPGGEWRLAFRSAESAGIDESDLYLIFFFLALLPAIISTFLIQMWLSRNLLASLKSEVHERTRQLKETNTLFDSVLSSANSFAIIAMTPEGVIKLFNTGAERMLGYQGHELINKASFSVCFYDYQPETVLFKDLNEASNKTLEMTYKHRLGEPIEVHLVLSPIKNEQQKIVGYLAIAEDIRERKRMERMKTEFISTVSHELRTPLTAISGSLALIRGGVAGELSETLTKMMDVAFNNCQRLNALINDLLDMEKLVAGKMSFDLRVHRVCTLLEQTIESNQSYADQYQVHLDLLTCDPMLEFKIDEMRFAQIMSNLISNAAKFSPAGAHVELSASKQGERVRISVRDYGQGIPEAFQERIFQKFSQADSSDSRPKGGTGLGLAITRELVEGMQGEIGFRSSEGGTEFFVYFQIAN